MKRSAFKRSQRGLKRKRMKAPRLTAKRQERRERRAAWAVAVKARDKRCRYQEGWEPVLIFGLPRGVRTVTWWCGENSTDAHHALARSQGGPDEMWNGLGMCHEHHMWVHDHRIEAQALGLLAHVGDCSELPEEDR